MTSDHDDIEISIAAYTFHALFADREGWLQEYLELVEREFGLQVADVWNGSLGTVEDHYLSREGIEHVVRSLGRAGASVVNYHVDGPTLWDPIPERLRLHEVSIRRHLELATRVGARTVRVDAGGLGSVWSPEAFDQIVSGYRQLCGIADTHGFRIGPENHWGPEIVPANMLALAQAVDHPAFGVLVHLNHWDAPDPSVGDSLLAPYAMHLHVDESLTSDRLVDAWRTMVAANYRGTWAVEVASGIDEISVAHRIRSDIRGLSLRAFGR